MSTFLSVWDAIEEDPVQAEVMKVRSALMRNIRERIAAAGWGPVDAASRRGVTGPRLAEIFSGKVDAFTIEDLVRIGVRAGLTVRICPEAEGR